MSKNKSETKSSNPWKTIVIITVCYLALKGFFGL